MKRVIIAGDDLHFFIEEMQEGLTELGADIKLTYVSSPGALQHLIREWKSEGIKPDIVAVPWLYREPYIRFGFENSELGPETKLFLFALDSEVPRAQKENDTKFGPAEVCDRSEFWALTEGYEDRARTQTFRAYLQQNGVTNLVIKGNPPLGAPQP